MKNYLVKIIKTYFTKFCHTYSEKTNAMHCWVKTDTSNLVGLRRWSTISCSFYVINAIMPFIPHFICAVFWPLAFFRGRSGSMEYCSTIFRWHLQQCTFTNRLKIDMFKLFALNLHSARYNWQNNIIRPTRSGRCPAPVYRDSRPVATAYKLSYRRRYCKLCTRKVDVCFSVSSLIHRRLLWCLVDIKGRDLCWYHGKRTLDDSHPAEPTYSRILNLTHSACVINRPQCS